MKNSSAFSRLFTQIGMGGLLAITLTSCQAPLTPLWVSGIFTPGKGCEVQAESLHSTDPGTRSVAYKNPETVKSAGPNTRTLSPDISMAAIVKCSFKLPNPATVNGGSPNEVVSVIFSFYDLTGKFTADGTTEIHEFIRHRQEKPFYAPPSIWIVFEGGGFTRGNISYEATQGRLSLTQKNGVIVGLKFRVYLEETSMGGF